MSKRRAVRSDLLLGLATGLLWTVGFFAAFPVWRYTNLPGTALLALAAAVLLSFLLSRRGWRSWGFSLLAGTLLAVILVPLIWSAPWFNRFYCALYEGAHVTEAGFAGLFTIFVYGALSLLCLPLTFALLMFQHIRRKGQQKDL